MDELTMEPEWEIKSPARCCARTGQQFKQGEFFYTLLFRDGDGFRREDITEEAWKGRNENIEPFSFWRSKYEAPASPATKPLLKDDVETLLRQLIAEQNPASNNVRYILALMLERKRVLRPMESSDSSLLVYEHAGTGESLVVANPHLSLETISDIQREVYGMLARSL
ncbi:MAG TPA: hypothetical protein VIS99_10575 [Terrimicrobiaceae bacterium]